MSWPVAIQVNGHLISMILDCKLTSAAQTCMIEFTYCSSVKGITPVRMVKHFSFLIKRSTCTHSFAILLVIVEALAESLPFFISGGASSFVCRRANRSWMLNPLSAIIVSPGFNWSKKAHFFCNFFVTNTAAEKVGNKVKMWYRWYGHKQFKSVSLLVAAVCGPLWSYSVRSFNVELSAVNNASQIGNFFEWLGQI